MHHYSSPVQIIDTDDLNGEFGFEMASIIQPCPNNFKELRKMKDYKIKLYSDEKVKPVAVPARSVPYHLQDRVADSLENMMKNGVIEERSSNEPAPWDLCAVAVPKDDGSLSVNLDACNLNKTLISTHYPKQEDINAQLSGSMIFRKLDFKFAFWQLELQPDSRYFTVFMQIITLSLYSSHYGSKTCPV